MNEPPSDVATFEQSLSELERIVNLLEDGPLGLEESLSHYEKGVGLLKHCYGQLSAAEQRILLLTGADAEGRPMTEPFAHAATAADPPKRRRKIAAAEELVPPEPVRPPPDSGTMP